MCVCPPPGYGRGLSNKVRHYVATVDEAIFDIHFAVKAVHY